MTHDEYLAAIEALALVQDILERTVIRSRDGDYTLGSLTAPHVRAIRLVLDSRRPEAPAQASERPDVVPRAGSNSEPSEGPDASLRAISAS